MHHSEIVHIFKYAYIYLYIHIYFFIFVSIIMKIYIYILMNTSISVYCSKLYTHLPFVPLHRFPFLSLTIADPPSSTLTAHLDTLSSRTIPAQFLGITKNIQSVYMSWQFITRFIKLAGQHLVHRYPWPSTKSENTAQSVKTLSQNTFVLFAIISESAQNLHGPLDTWHVTRGHQKFIHFSSLMFGNRS